MNTSSSRSTILTRTSLLYFAETFFNAWSQRTEFSSIRYFTSSIFPFAKVSILMAEGNFNTRAISIAAASSGLMTMESPISSLIKLISLLYTGLRTLAMVWHPPAFFAIKQHKRFSSSELVTAINKSACSMPASICMEYPAPFPTTPIMSNVLLTCFTTSFFISMIVMLCPSLLNCSASVEPTLPQPTIIICISSSHSALPY